MNTFSPDYVLLYEQPLLEKTLVVLKCGIKSDAADGE